MKKIVLGIILTGMIGSSAMAWEPGDHIYLENMGEVELLTKEMYILCKK